MFDDDLSLYMLLWLLILMILWGREGEAI